MIEFSMLCFEMICWNDSRGLALTNDINSILFFQVNAFSEGVDTEWVWEEAVT